MRSSCSSVDFFSDDFRLSGEIHLPENSRPPVVIGVHGLLSDKSSAKQTALAKECNRLGLGYFRFDHRGCGKSDGRFEQVTSFKGRCHDLAKAIETVLSLSTTGDRIGLFGSSIGGTVSLAIAAQCHVSAIVTWAAPVSSRELSEALEQPSSGVNRQVLENLGFDLRNTLPGISDVLVIHGESDELVPPWHAQDIYRLAAQPKRLMMLPGEDHRMSGKCHQKLFLCEASRWFKDAFERSYHLT